MNHYADSSFLVSCYVTDANTASAKGYLLRTGVPLVFTALHALEVRNAGVHFNSGRTHFGNGSVKDTARPCSNTATLRNGVLKSSLSKIQT